MLTPPTSLHEKISQLIFPRIGSNMMPTISVEDDAARIERLMDDYPVGGLCLFNGDRIQTPQTLARLQSRSAFPLLVATDMERGLGQQLKGATVFPHAMAFQATGKEAEALLEASARAAAREALAAGLHISFSPVADIHSNPANPIISTRAYGTSPETVSDLLRAYIKGCQAEGLFTTAKHFPGHGDTDVDSHETLPVVTRDREALEAQEFIPFRSAMEAGVSLIMTAHVAYPALDPSGVEATRSGAIMRDLLRKEMGFKGVLISDSLLMAGAGGREEHPGEMAAALLEAGLDILLDIKDIPATVDYLVSAIESGQLPESLVDAALSRVWSLKVRFAARFGKGAFVDPSLAVPYDEIGCQRHRELADTIASKAIQAQSGSKESFRLPAPRMGQKGPICFLVRPHTTYNDPTQAPLEKAFLKAFPDGAFVEINPDTDSDEQARALEAAGHHRAVIVAAVVKPAAWHRFGLLPMQKAFIQQLTDAYPVWLAALGTPHVLDDFPDVRASMCAFSDVEPSMNALVRFLQQHDSPAHTPSPGMLP